MDSTEGVGLPRPMTAGLCKLSNMSVEAELGPSARTVALTTEPSLRLTRVSCESYLLDCSAHDMNAHPFFWFFSVHTILQGGFIYAPLSCAPEPCL